VHGGFLLPFPVGAGYKDFAPTELAIPWVDQAHELNAVIEIGLVQSRFSRACYADSLRDQLFARLSFAVTGFWKTARKVVPVRQKLGPRNCVRLGDIQYSAGHRRPLSGSQSSNGCKPPVLLGPGRRETPTRGHV